MGALKDIVALFSRAAAGETMRVAAAIAQEELTELEGRSAQLSEILAIIHRDGGHYENEHGSIKATADAIEKIYALRSSEV